MAEIYVIHWLAKELGGDYVTSMVEYVTTDKVKAQQYFYEHMPEDRIMNIDSHMCEVRRQIVTAVIDQPYKP